MLICPEVSLISVFDPCINRGRFFGLDFEAVKGRLIHG